MSVILLGKSSVIHNTLPQYSIVDPLVIFIDGFTNRKMIAKYFLGTYILLVFSLVSNFTDKIIDELDITDKKLIDDKFPSVNLSVIYILMEIQLNNR
jgi:hypothetical protein